MSNSELKSYYYSLLSIFNEVTSRCNSLSSVRLNDSRAVDTLFIAELHNYYLQLIKYHYYKSHLDEISEIKDKACALHKKLDDYFELAKRPKLLRIFLPKDKKEFLNDMEIKGGLEYLKSDILWLSSNSLSIAEGYVNDYQEHKDEYYEILLTQYANYTCIDSNLLILSNTIDYYKKRIENKVFNASYFYRSVHTVCNSIIESERMKRMASTNLSSIKNRSKGISFKRLENAGYKTLWDVHNINIHMLLSLPTVTDSNYIDFKQDIDDALNVINKRVTITLNIDNLSKEKLALLDLARYDMEKQAIADRIESIYKELTSIESDVNELLNSDDTIARFIYGGVEEFKVRYNALNSRTNAVKYELDGIARILNAIDGGYQAFKDTLEDFKKRPVEYISTLAKIAPEYFDNTTDYTSSLKDKEEINRISLIKDSLRCVLRPYQEFGSKYILHNHNVLLGDDMGLGKTIQAMSVMCHLRSDGKKYFMVVCPVGLIANWCNEIKMKSTLFTYKLRGHDISTIREWWNRGGVIVTNYENLKDTQDYFTKRIDFIVVDEAHNIKNQKAARSAATLNVCNKADKKLFMTGTPLENHVREMIGLLKYLEPSIGNKFHCEHPDSEYFKEAIKNVYYRRKKEDVLTELPDLLIQEDWCEMTTEDSYVYKWAVLDKQIMDMRRVGWHSNYKCSSKIKMMTDIINQAIDDGRKVIIFSYFLKTLDIIEDYLGTDFSNLVKFRIDGGVSAEKRQGIINEFTEETDTSILLSQVTTGGVGLNIQAASLVILCEPQVKPSMEEQAISRSHRMGQVRNVIVHKLLCRNTVDERMLVLLNRKKQDFLTYADESVAACNAMIELNKATMTEIVEQEYEKWSK